MLNRLDTLETQNTQLVQEITRQTSDLTAAKAEVELAKAQAAAAIAASAGATQTAASQHLERPTADPSITK